MAAPGRRGSQVISRSLRSWNRSSGANASAVKEPGHFEVKKSSSQVTGCTFPPKVDDFFQSSPRRRQNTGRQRRWLFHCQNKTNKAVRYGNVFTVGFVKGAEWGGEWERVSLFPADQGMGSVVSFPSGVRGRFLVENDFGAFWGRQNGSRCNTCYKFCIFLTRLEAWDWTITNLDRPIVYQRPALSCRRPTYVVR